MEDFVVNADCNLYPSGEVPKELAFQSEQLSIFASHYPIVWVRDQVSGYLNPFWVGPKLESTIRMLLKGEPLRESLPTSAHSVLEGAGILVSQTSIAHQRAEQQDALRRASELFRNRGYAPLRGLIHPFHIAALRRYYRQRLRSRTIPLGDGQSSRRYVSYNDPVARFFHRQMATTLTTIVGEPIKPSYVYLASYLEGAELKKHVDRAQCEFSVTLCLDFSPEPALATPWPICLDTPTGRVRVYQMLGDGLAYRGTQLPHYRSKLPGGQTSTSIFFHYVSENFIGSLD